MPLLIAHLGTSKQAQCAHLLMVPNSQWRLVVLMSSISEESHNVICFLSERANEEF
jgi:hypothetical protein